MGGCVGRSWRSSWSKPSSRKARRNRAPRGAARAPLAAGIACEFIERHLVDLERPLTLSAIASAAGLSPFHFVRLFRRHFGVTPHQYVIRARLRRAIQLLRETSLPVTEIAWESGFGDLSNFVHTFRRHVGCTPGVLSSRRASRTNSWIEQLRRVSEEAQ